MLQLCDWTHPCAVTDERSKAFGQSFFNINILLNLMVLINGKKTEHNAVMFTVMILQIQKPFYKHFMKNFSASCRICYYKVPHPISMNDPL